MPSTDRNTLHYKGDVRDFDPNQILGPDMDQALYVISRVDYDAGNDMSTATLRPIYGEELTRVIAAGMGVDA